MAPKRPFTQRFWTILKKNRGPSKRKLRRFQDPRRKSRVVCRGQLGENEGLLPKSTGGLLVWANNSRRHPQYGHLLTARMMPHYTNDPEEAIEHIEEFVDALPDTSFSDRLSSGNRKEVSRIIGISVTKIYDGNGGQPRIEESSGKLGMTKRAVGSRWL